MSFTLTNRWTAAALYQEIADGFWRLGDPVGSSTAADQTFNTNTATVVGTVTFGQSGWPSGGDNAALFDGSTGYLNVGNVSTFAYPLRFTAVAAFKSTGVVEQAIIGKWNTGSSTGWQLVLASTGKVRFDGYSSSGAVFSVVSSSAYNDGAYHQVVAVHDPLDSSTSRLYVDGTLIVSATPTAVAIASTSTRMLIGNRD